MKKILDLIMILCCMAASLFCFTSCSDDLDIQQEYPFTVEAMPVADKIVSGQTVEIRLEITEEGNFSGTLYTLRYFQPDGNGLLKLEDGTVLKPNDRYLLSEKKFRCITLQGVRMRHKRLICTLKITGRMSGS